VLAQLEADFPDDLRVVYRHFPLIQIHDKALLAAQAAEAAGLQGKFWEMHDLLYQQVGAWTPLSVEAFQEWLLTRAEELGLEAAQFEADLTSQTIVRLARDAYDAGASLGIPGTPFLLINDRIYSGPSDYANLSAIVKLLALQKRQFTQCPPLVIDPLKQYIATLETEKGDIVIELLPEESPLAVNNFVFLAQQGWYDGVTFHRVLEGFMAQTGDPSGTGYGGPGYAFVNERGDRTFDSPGLVAMANAGPDTNGSQFFITLGPAHHLDGGYTIFGRVIEGMEVLYHLRLRDPSQNANLPPGDEIIRVIIEEK
jgi:cyclophilin family peptidyl-prolyl cis-trans isomerase